MGDTDQRGAQPGPGTIQRMDNIATVVDDAHRGIAEEFGSGWPQAVVEPTLAEQIR